MSTGRVVVESLSLPFQGAEPMSRHCSHAGAVAAIERVGRQCLELMTAYRERGALTDAEAALVLGIERSTINARRAELVKRGLVRAVGTKKNESTGVSNTTWGFVG